MPRNPRQKQKLLYLKKILLEKTDEEHGLTVNELIAVPFGAHPRIEITSYSVTDYRLDDYDMKTLVPRQPSAVQSSKFITEKKSMELIKKVESLASENEAKLFQSQVIISNRVKTPNETIYYNIDRLHDAINHNRAVTFYYNEWTLNLGSSEKIKLRRRRDGALYRVSPWALCWDDENYYLIAFDDKSESIRHYRVDKMEKITVTDDSRKGDELVKKINLADYAKSTFSMFAGESVELTLSVHNSLVGVIADRFGKNVFITRDDNKQDFFILKTNVNISGQFFGWIFALGDKVEIVSPEEVRARFKAHVGDVSKIYREEKP